MGDSDAARADTIGVSGTTRGELTEDDLFELLSNQRRRYLLRTLIRENDAVDVGRLAQEIAAWEDGLAFEEVPSADRKRVYTALKQSHLTKLSEAGVIEFDCERGLIEPAPALEDVALYMDVVQGRGVAWSDYYLGLAVVAGLSFVASTVDLFPFVRLSPFTWTVLVIGAFAVSAFIHRSRDRRKRLDISSEPTPVQVEYPDHVRGD